MTYKDKVKAIYQKDQSGLSFEDWLINELEKKAKQCLQMTADLAGLMSRSTACECRKCGDVTDLV